MTYFDAERGADLKTAFDERVASWPEVAARSMFGCPSYTADGTLFAVLVTDGVALTRLPDERRAELDRAFAVGPFRAGERTVPKWAQVTIAEPAALDDLLPFVRASYETALAE